MVDYPYEVNFMVNTTLVATESFPGLILHDHYLLHGILSLCFNFTVSTTVEATESCPGLI